MTALALFYILALFMLGAILGSFLNVVAVDSMNVYMREKLYEKSELRFVWKSLRSKDFWSHMLKHRSACDTCDTVLTPKELVPVVSYLWQKGKCKTCDVSFSPQHLYVELFAGVIFLGVFLAIFNSYAVLSPLFVIEVLYFFVFFGLAIILTLFDYEHMIVPNLTVYPMLIMAFVAHILPFQSVPQIGLIEAVSAALLLALPLFLFWYVSKGTWMGMADSKIALVIGALLGLGLGFSAWVLSFWIGAAIGLLLIFAARLRKDTDGVGMKTAIPFGPFLIIGLWACYVTGYNLFLTGIL